MQNKQNASWQELGMECSRTEPLPTPSSLSITNETCIPLKAPPSSRYLLQNQLQRPSSPSRSPRRNWDARLGTSKPNLLNHAKVGQLIGMLRATGCAGEFDSEHGSAPRSSNDEVALANKLLNMTRLQNRGSVDCFRNARREQAQVRWREALKKVKSSPASVPLSSMEGTSQAFYVVHNKGQS